MKKQQSLMKLLIWQNFWTFFCLVETTDEAIFIALGRIK